jgi:dephospho-CoA kinase
MQQVPVNLKVVGLLGGVASGKSVVASALARRGALLLDADRAGHAVLRDPDVEALIHDRWGTAVLDPEGHVYRPALAKIVFAPTAEGARELAYLESITHPRIGIKLKTEFEQIAAKHLAEVVVLDAPVMLKAGWDRLCTLFIFVDAPLDVRRQRASERGWSAEEFHQREAAQEPVEVKRKMASIVLDNSGTIAETESQIDRFWDSLLSQ